MPAFRSRFAVLAAALIALAPLHPGQARAATSAAQAERIAQFARRMKQLQQHLLLEGDERGGEGTGEERLGPPSDTSEAAGARGLPPRSLLESVLGVAALGTNVRANDPTLDGPAAAQSEVAVGTLGDNVLVAFNDGQGFIPYPRFSSQGYAYSTNGGQSFTDGGAQPTVPDWLWDSDPVVAVNESSGEFWYLGLNSQSGQNGIALVKATFSGGILSWGTPHLVRSSPNDQVLLDKPWMAVDPASGRLYVVYTSFGAYTGTDTIEFQASSDGGVTWTDPLALSDPGDQGYVQGARVAVRPGGEVIATWYVIGRTAPYTDAFPVRVSTNGGATFSPAVSAAHFFSNFSSGAPGFNRPRGIAFPTLAVDRSNGAHRGRIYVGWSEAVDYYADALGTLTGQDEGEPNDTPAQAKAFTVGDSLYGTLTPGDIDMFQFTATQGQTVVLFAGVVDFMLDMSMRVLCGDGNTQLALSAPGAGYPSLIVFTVPVTGTYYMRLKDLSGSGVYTVYTGFHTPQSDDRARDHRDVFVASSDDGVVWSTPKLVNDDPPWLDNWLPELAVSNLSKVYASWYDWRDGPPSVCNALSLIYLASSDDGGATWSTLGALSDAPSDWNDWVNAKANIQPNQGDYNVLFADCQAVYGGWSDARDADVNVYVARYPPLSQPTLVTFASATAQPHQVSLVWQAHVAPPPSGTVERADVGGGAWTPLGPATVDLAGRMFYADTTVSPGSAYEYRLTVPQPPSGDWITCAVEVVVPVEVRVLVLEPARPNPTSGDIIVSFDLPTNAPAKLELLDLAGRKLHSVEVGSLGPGRLTINLGTGLDLRSGIYFVRLEQGGVDKTTRISVVR